MTKPEAPVANKSAPAPAPQDISAQLATAQHEGATAERQRVLAILAQTGEGQHELALSLIDTGKSLQEALLAINQDLRAKLAVKPQAGAEPSVSLARGNTANVVTDSKASRLAAMPEGETKWRAEFDASAELQQEFGGDVEVFLGFKRNEVNQKVAKSKD